MISVKRKPALALVLLCAVALSIASCATQPVTPTSSPPGFFLGLLHGFLIVFSFVGSLDRTPAFEPPAMWESEHITRHSRQTRRAVFGSAIYAA
jgi:hypothetical protein